VAKTDDYLIKIHLELQNAEELKVLNAELDKTAKAAPKAAEGVEDVGKEATKSTKAAKILGYSVGTILVGAMVAAVKLFKSMQEETRSFDEALSDLNSSISNLTNFTQAIDFTGWIDNWNKSTAAIRESELALLNFRNTAASAALQDTLKSLNAEVTEQAGFMDLAKSLPFVKERVQAFNYVFNDLLGTMKEAAGVTDTLALEQKFRIDPATAQQLLEIEQQLRSGAISEAQFADQLVILGANTENATQEFYKFVEAANELKQGVDSLTKSTELAQRASAGGILAGGTPAKAGKTPRGGTLSEIVPRGEKIDPYGEAMNEQLERTKELYAELYPDAVAYAETQFMLNEALAKGILNQDEYNKKMQEAQVTFEKSQEQWTIGGELLKTFDDNFNTMLDGVLQGTQDLKDGITDMVKVMIAQFLKLAAYQAIFSAFGINLGLPTTANADGNVISKGNVIPFARGGIVNGPTVFPMANGAGLMGEAGPEAIMPLSRAANGKLGVGAAPVNVVVNNNAAGVAVNARQTDQGLTIDIVMEQVSAAISRGGNPVANALESSYSLGRGRGVY